MFCIMIGNCAHIDGHGVADSPSTTSTEVSYYSNGQQEYVAEYLNGKLDGTSRQWSEVMSRTRTHDNHGQLSTLLEQFSPHIQFERPRAF